MELHLNEYINNNYSDSDDEEMFKCDCCKEYVLNEYDNGTQELKYECCYCDNKSVCESCVNFMIDYDGHMCNKCFEQHKDQGGYECDFCQMVIPMDEEIDIIADKTPVKWWKHNKASDVHWLDNYHICDGCYFDLQRQDKLDECDNCKDAFMKEECLKSVNENGSCHHCHYKQKKLAKMALERIKKIPIDIERQIISNYL
mgnify:CR=1 FL=1